MLPFQPPEQRWTKVETNILIIVDEAFRTRILIDDVNSAVRLIAFGMNAFVPVVKRMCAWFRIDYACPRVLAGRLIKMAVND